MEFIQQFKKFLLSQRTVPSQATVKNYLADIRHFISWYESFLSKSFVPSEATFAIINQFRQQKAQEYSVRSIERHISSLRKFFQAMKLQGAIAESPFEQNASAISSNTQDPWHLKEFKDFLYVYNASRLTIKNYIIDVKQFLQWAEEVTRAKDSARVSEKNVLGYLSNALLAEYKLRLFQTGSFSASSINRKLSSLRKYLTWASKQGLLSTQIAIPDNLNAFTKYPSTNLESLLDKEVKLDQKQTKDFSRDEVAGQVAKQATSYSAFPPFRLLQKMGKGLDRVLEALVVTPLTLAALFSHKQIWKLRGKPLFESPKQNESVKVHNIAKEVYAPHAISTRLFPWYKKLMYHARYTRPDWYRRYHQLALAHYFNWAVLMIFCTVIGYGMYNTLVAKPQQKDPALAASSPPRILSFQGRLTDTSDTPITASTNLRFAIYSDSTASGSALLWQEVNRVTPDSNGVFSVLLGKGTTIPQSLFANNQSLYLGIAVGATAELTPRQQLATVAYATNAETLQGLPPITQSGAGTTNVVLALNSSGNLSIGASTTFQSTSGTFTLAGNTVAFNTNSGTNGNITFTPDGSGVIDLQKPLQNTTLNNNIGTNLGAVEIDDLFAVLATSAASAVIVNQNGTGALFTASSSGTTKFTVGNGGSITSANYTLNGGVFYADGNGLFAQTSVGNPGQCLTSNGGGSPSWTSCSSASNYWNLSNGSLFPVNSTLDVFFGGTASSSANFAFINNASGTPTASIAGNLTLNSNGVIQTTNNRPLTIGGGSTGNIILSPNNGSGSVTVNGNISSNLIPSVTSTFDLGSSSLKWNNLYVNNIFQSGVALTQLWQRNAGVLSPLNITDDLAIGGTATSTAKFQVFANTGSATTAGTLTFDNTGSLIQTTKNQGLTIGGNTTGNIILSPLNGSGGTVTINGLTTGVVHSSGGVLTSSTVALGSEVSGTLPIANGGTNASTIGLAGSVAYSTGTSYGFSGVGSTGNCLISNGSTAPSWSSCSAAAGATNYWTLDSGLGTLYPINTTLDVFFGGTASSSANFAFINNAGGTPTASIAGNLTLNSSGSIQTTNNRPLTIGGASTGNIILSPNNGNGIVTINGKLNSSLIPVTTDTYDLGSPSLEWNNLYVKNIISTGGTISGFWQRNLGVLSPTNITDDLAIGGTATSTAKFQIFANTGNATTTGNLTFTGGSASNVIATRNNQGLTIGDSQTGNITISALNGGAGSTINLNAANIATNQTSLNLFNSTTTTLNFGGAVTTASLVTSATTLHLGDGAVTNTVSIGGTVGGTTTINNALAVTGAANLNGNVTLGDASADTINPLGVFSGSLIPQSTTVNLGSATNYFGSAFITNLFPSSTSNFEGFWQRFSGVLSPTNITDDLAIGGTATSTAKFQVFSATGNATTAGNLTFSTSGSIQTTSNLPLTIGGTSTGNIILSPNNGSGSVTINGKFNSNLIPFATDTYDLGSAPLEWNNLYVKNLISGGTISGFWQRNLGVLAPTNITDDLAIGGIASTTAKFQVFGNTGNATSTGTLTFTGSPATIQTTSMIPLTLGSTTTGPIQLSPKGTTGLYVAGSGNVGINTTNPSTFPLQVAGNTGPDANNTYDLGSSTLQWRDLYLSRNLIAGANSNYDGFWQRFSGTLSPTNITDDLAIGGTATSTAKFQVFGNSGNATTTGTLTFAGTAGSNVIGARNNTGLTIGDSQTGNIVFTGNGNVGIGTTTPQEIFDVASRGSTFPSDFALNQISATNLVSNPSFEFSGNQKNQWTFNRTPEFAASNQATESAVFGGYALRMDSSLDTGSTFTATGVCIPATGNTPYTLSAYLKVKSGFSGNVGINFQTFTNTTCTAGQATAGRVNTATTDAWTRVTSSITTGASVLGIQAQFIADNSAVGIAYADAFQLEQSSSATPYLDGSLGPGYAWNGVPNATTSARFAGSAFAYQTLNAAGGLGAAARGIQTALQLDQDGTGNIITASASGVNQFNLTNAGIIQARSFQDLDATSYLLDPASTGNALLIAGTEGIGTLTPLALSGIDIEKDAKGNATLVVANLNTAGDLFTASNSAGTKFTIANNGTISKSGYLTGILHSNGSGLITSSIVDLTADVGSSILPLANGGTNNNLTADNGGIVYSDATKLQILAHAAIAGQCLTSGGLGPPSWATCATGGAGTNWWNMNLGALFPINTTLDMLVGGSSTDSAKFAVLNMAGGTPTASVSSGLNGSATYLTANGTLQTANFGNLTIGGATTGDITLTPHNGTGGVTVNGVRLDTTAGGFDLINTGAVAVNFAGAATTLNIAASTGTTTINNALQVKGTSLTTNQTTFSLLNSTATTINFAGAATTLNIGVSGGTTTNAGNETVNGDVTLGTNTTNTLTIKAALAGVSNKIIPSTNGLLDLGDSTHYFNNIYANNVLAPVGSGTSGFWALSNNNLYPVNQSYDLLVGGTATGSATPWQVFSQTLGVATAGTATSSGGLSFRGANTQVALLNGSVLQVKTSVGGDGASGANLTTQLTLANNGDLTLNGANIITSQASLNLFNTTATTLNFAGAATTLNIGNASGNTLLRGNITLGSGTGNTINPVGKFSGSLIPTSTSIDLGSTANPFGNLYLSTTGGIGGFWQLNSGVVSPTNITNDLAIGGTATSTAKFQVFGNTGNATSTGTLTFTGSPATIQTTSMIPLTLGSTTTGPIQLSPKGTTGLYVAGSGNVGINTTNPSTFPLQVAGNTGPDANNTYDLGSSTLQWRDLYLSRNLIAGTGSNFSGFWQRFSGTLSPTNITDDILAGATATTSAKFAVLNMASGTPTASVSSGLSGNGMYFDANGNVQTMRNAGLTLGGATTGNIILKPLNGIAGSFISSFGSIIPDAADSRNLGSPSLEWDTLYVRQIVSPSSGGVAGFWQLNNGVLAPANLTNDLAVGGVATNSAVWQVYGRAYTNDAPAGVGTTVPAGTATSSAGLTFRGGTTDTIRLLDGTKLSIWASAGGDAGLGGDFANPIFSIIGHTTNNANNPNGSVVLGSSSVLNTRASLELLNNPNGIHLAQNAADTGGYIDSIGSTSLLLNGGAQYNPAAGIWTAKATTASSVDFSTGRTLFLNADGLTAGNNFDFITTNRIAGYMDEHGKTGLGGNASIGIANAQLIVNQTNNVGLGDILTASASGTTKLVLTNDGSLVIGSGITSSTALANSGVTISKNGLGNSIFLADQLGLGDIMTASASGITHLQLTNAGILRTDSFQDLQDTRYFLDPAATGLALQISGTASTAANLTFADAGGTAPGINILNNNKLQFFSSVGGDAGLNTAIPIFEVHKSATVELQASPSANFSFGTAGSSTLRVLGNLNSANAAATTLMLANAGLPNTVNRIGFMDLQSGISYAQLESGRTAANGGGYIDLRTATASDGTITEAMRITNQQRVGIGLTAPSNLLHVAGDAQVGKDATTWGSSFSSYLNRRQINISNTASQALISYQVRISIDTASLISAGKMLSSCNDIRFSDSDGSTSLTFWLESGCNTSATTFWVNVPSIPFSTKTIYAYYNNAAATSASSTTAFVRTVGSLNAAWRLDEPTYLPINDFSGNNNVATTSGTTIASPGKFINARTFSSTTSDFATASPSATVDIAAPLSVGIWFKVASGYSANAILIGNDSVTGTRNRYALAIGRTTAGKVDAVIIAGGGAAQTVTSTNTYNDGNWHYAVMTLSSNTGILTLYVDGASTGTPINPITGTFAAPNGDVELGAAGVSVGVTSRTNFLTGSLDEPRIYSKSLSSAEVTDLYNNYGYVTQASPGNEYVRAFVSSEPTISSIAPEQSSTQLLPNFFVDNITGNVALGSTSLASTSARLSVAGDIKSGLYDPTAWIASSNGMSYRQRITIDNTNSASSSANANYAVQVTANTSALVSATKLRSDCADIKFTDADGTTSLSFWRETACNTTSTTFWVKVPTLPPAQKKNIYMYYGNSSNTTDGSSTANTFVRTIANVKVAYRMDEASGNLTDYSGNGVTGTVTGTTVASGVFNNSRIFNGVSDMVSFTRNVSDDFSLAFWFKTNAVGPTGCNWFNGNGLVDGEVAGLKNDFGVSFGCTNGKRVMFGTGNTITDTTIPSTADLADGVWHHVVATRVKSSGAMKLYIDGEQNASGTGGTTSLTDPTNLNIGRLQSGSNYFNGQIDEVRVYGAALSAAEVYDLYAKGNKPGNYYGYVTTNSPGNEYVRAFQNPEPSTSVDTEQDPSQIDPVLYANASLNRVGIGTANPTAVLDIQGAGSASNSALAISGLSLNLNTTATAAVFNQTGTGNLLDIQKIGTSKFNIVNSGDVGVNMSADTGNTASQYYTMQVASNGTGNIYLQGTNASIGFWDGNGGHTMMNQYYDAVNGKIFFNNVSTGTTEFSFSSAGVLNARGAINATTIPDIAESIAASDVSIEAGDIVVADPGAKEHILKSNATTGSELGVISTKPGILIHSGQSDNQFNQLNPDYRPLVLAGRVPTKVTSLNGPVKIGDRITASEIEGFGKKATKAGMVVATALEDFIPSDTMCPPVASLHDITWPDDDGRNPAKPCYKLPDGTYVGKIMAFVKVGWYDPDVYLTDTGNLNITPSNLAGTPYAIADISGNPISRMGAFLSLAVANLRAGFVSAQSISANSLTLATANVSIAGQSLHDYVAGIVSEVISSQPLSNGQAVTSPVGSFDQLHAGIISPLGQNGQIALSLDNSGVSVKNTISQQTVARIDNSGNATFSGQLASQNLAVNGDATVSGTLRANRIEANTIAGLEAVVSTLSAQNITNVTNMYFATSSAQSNAGNNVIGSNFASSSNSGVLANQVPFIGYADIASYSGFLAYVPNLNATTAMFSQGLISLGQTSLSDTTINGQLAVGTQLIIADNSVNVLGGTFQVQSLRQGNVSFEGGLIAIDTDGNLTVNGNAVFAKNLAANFITPLSNDRNLTFKLGENNIATGSALATATLSVQNASGSGIFNVDQLGNLIASGAASIAKLNFTAVQPVLAVSNTEVVATGSAGTAAIKAHQTEITIDNKLVTPKSLIYITPVGQTNYTPYLLRQVSGTSFTVGIPLQQLLDTTFNWLIVN